MYRISSRLTLLHKAWPLFFGLWLAILGICSMGSNICYFAVMTPAGLVLLLLWGKFYSRLVQVWVSEDGRLRWGSTRSFTQATRDEVIALKRIPFFHDPQMSIELRAANGTTRRICFVPSRTRMGFFCTAENTGEFFDKWLKSDPGALNRNAQAAFPQPD